MGELTTEEKNVITYAFRDYRDRKNDKIVRGNFENLIKTTTENIKKLYSIYDYCIKNFNISTFKNSMLTEIFNIINEDTKDKLLNEIFLNFESDKQNNLDHIIGINNDVVRRSTAANFIAKQLTSNNMDADRASILLNDLEYKIKDLFLTDYINNHKELKQVLFDKIKNLDNIDLKYIEETFFGDRFDLIKEDLDNISSKLNEKSNDIKYFELFEKLSSYLNTCYKQINMKKENSEVVYKYEILISQINDMAANLIDRYISIASEEDIDNLVKDSCKFERMNIIIFNELIKKRKNFDLNLLDEKQKKHLIESYINYSQNNQIFEPLKQKIVNNFFKNMIGMNIYVNSNNNKEDKVLNEKYYTFDGEKIKQTIIGSNNQNNEILFEINSEKDDFENVTREITYYKVGTTKENKKNNKLSTLKINSSNKEIKFDFNNNEYSPDEFREKNYEIFKEFSGNDYFNSDEAYLAYSPLQLQLEQEKTNGKNYDVIFISEYNFSNLGKYYKDSKLEENKNKAFLCDCGSEDHQIQVIISNGYISIFNTESKEQFNQINNIKSALSNSKINIDDKYIKEFKFVVQGEKNCVLASKLALDALANQYIKSGRDFTKFTEDINKIQDFIENKNTIDEIKNLKNDNPENYKDFFEIVNIISEAGNYLVKNNKDHFTKINEDFKKLEGNFKEVENIMVQENLLNENNSFKEIINNFDETFEEQKNMLNNQNPFQEAINKVNEFLSPEELSK